MENKIFCNYILYLIPDIIDPSSLNRGGRSDDANPSSTDFSFRF